MLSLGLIPNSHNDITFSNYLTVTHNIMKHPEDELLLDEGNVDSQESQDECLEYDNFEVDGM